MELKIAFLFGAGCECNKQFNLPSGAVFHRDTVVANNVTNIIECINSTEIRKLTNGSIISANSTSILYQSLLELGIDKFCLSEEDRNTAQEYIAYKKSDIANDGISQKFKDLYKQKFYDKIKESTDKKLSSEVVYFLENACLYSFIDSHFNCLRKPEIYKNQTNMIIKVYFSAYKSILDAIIASEHVSPEIKKDYKSLRQSEISIFEKRKKLEGIVTSSQELISEKLKENKDIYYNIIQKYLTENGIEAGVITTNYTSFAEKLMGESVKCFVHLHGTLTEFEDLITKRISPLSSFDENDYIFPSILIQSGIKPIISTNQIQEFNKAIEMIKDSEHLIVLGYGINSDDEHITNFIRERLRSGKSVECFIYFTDDNKFIKEQERIEKLLGQNGNLKFYKTSEFETALNEILS